jgi:hypothetical protein
MKEEEIRPKKIFDEYLSLAKKDTQGRLTLEMSNEYLGVVLPAGLLEIMLLIKTGFLMKYALIVKRYL